MSLNDYVIRCFIHKVSFTISSEHARMTAFAASLYILFFISQVFGENFHLPAPTDPSTSDPYEIYLVNTFPLEIQTIVNRQNNESSNFFEKLVDQKIGTPLYAGLNVSKSRQIFIESFFNHFRTLDSIKKSTVSSEICLKNSSTIIPNNRRIFSIFHELNLPFEVPCFKCQPSESSTPNIFRIIKKRNIFAFDILSESTTVYDFMKEKFEGESETQIYAGDISLDGSFRWSPRLISEKFERVDFENGRFDFLPPNPATKVVENSMSLFCSKEENGYLNSPEIIVNVDTLRIPPKESSTLSSSSLNIEESLFFSSKDVHRFTVGDLTEWSEYKKTSTFPKLNVKYNLKVDIYWEKWSCCSACCCSEITCGHGYTTSKASCELISSHKNRKGFLSFFKIDPSKPIEILSGIERMLNGTDFYNETIDDVVQTFDLYLSSSPYANTGIPVHSTLLQTDRSWLILELFLNKNFGYRNESESSKELGLFIDTQTCEIDPQKLNCTVLQQCMDKELEISDYISPVEENTVAPPHPYQPNIRHPSKSDICDYQGVEDVLLKEKESVVDVDEGLSFRFAVDEIEYGELLSVKWRAGQSKISKFDPRKSCSAQRIFADENYLMILKVENDDSNLPYIAKATLKTTGEEILLKLSLHFQPKAKPSKHTSSILKWVAIAGGVLAAFLIIVVVIHIIQVRSLKKKLKQAAAPTATKTTDQQV